MKIFDGTQMRISFNIIDTVGCALKIDISKDLLIIQLMRSSAFTLITCTIFSLISHLFEARSLSVIFYAA